MLMIGIPVGSTLAEFNLGALIHSIGERLPNEWIPDTLKASVEDTYGGYTERKDFVEVNNGGQYEERICASLPKDPLALVAPPWE
ncbi:hypothetical protein DSO57_1001094 [Entomophthora muscae]|uniref:Uncharacterized protein n=1 Tax=Entomophthora muscae TaxID=34485 RepID=A0ACC2SAX4_9FUNG|nr:hypothetical protein DSO57_1001094 [Entomophthora muscae]